MGCILSSTRVHPNADLSKKQLLRKEGFDFTIKRSGKYDINMFKESSYNSAMKQCATHVCSSSGDLNTMKWLHSKGANLRTKNSYNQSPLLIACERGNLDVVDYLFSSGCEEDVFIPSNDGCTPLHLSRGDTFIWILNKIHTNQNKNNSSSRSLHGDKENIEENIKDYLLLGDNHGDTPLLFACIYGDLIACRHMIRKLGILNSSSPPPSRPPSIMELNMKEDKMNEVILKNETEKKEEEKGEEEGVEEEKGEVVEGEGGGERVGEKVAVEKREDGGGGNIDEIDSLKEVPKDPLDNHINHHGSTVLHNTCLGGNSELLLFLLYELKACHKYIHFQDCCQDTPLRIATQWNHTQCAYILIQYGALLDVKNKNNKNNSNNVAAFNEEREENDDNVKIIINKFLPSCTHVLDRDIPLASLNDKHAVQQVQSSIQSSTSDETLATSQRFNQEAPLIKINIRMLLKKYAMNDLKLYKEFRDSFLIGCLKKKSPNLSKLRKASKEIRDRPKILIADYVGILHGFRLHNIKQLLGLLEKNDR